MLSLISFIALLETIIGSSHHMPSTCPNGTRLVEHWESHSSIVYLSKSMSHSRVNSARAEWVVGSTLASSLWHKVVGAPWGVATRKILLQWAIFTLLLISLISYKGTPFVTWCTISYSTSFHQSSIFLSLETHQLLSKPHLPASVGLCL